MIVKNSKKFTKTDQYHWQYTVYSSTVQWWNSEQYVSAADEKSCHYLGIGDWRKHDSMILKW